MERQQSSTVIEHSDAILSMTSDVVGGSSVRRLLSREPAVAAAEDSDSEEEDDQDGEEGEEKARRNPEDPVGGCRHERSVGGSGGRSRENATR